MKPVAEILTSPTPVTLSSLHIDPKRLTQFKQNTFLDFLDETQTQQHPAAQKRLCNYTGGHGFKRQHYWC